MIIISGDNYSNHNCESSNYNVQRTITIYICMRICPLYTCYNWNVQTKEGRVKLFKEVKSLKSLKFFQKKKKEKRKIKKENITFECNNIKILIYFF